MTGVAAGGVVGGLIGGMVASAASAGKGWEGAPDFGTVGYVAVTADEIAIVKGKTGLFKPKVGSGSAPR